MHRQNCQRYQFVSLLQPQVYEVGAVGVLFSGRQIQPRLGLHHPLLGLLLAVARPADRCVVRLFGRLDAGVGSVVDSVDFAADFVAAVVGVAPGAGAISSPDNNAQRVATGFRHEFGPQRKSHLWNGQGIFHKSASRCLGF